MRDDGDGVKALLSWVVVRRRIIAVESFMIQKGEGGGGREKREGMLVTFRVEVSPKQFT